jgi:DNA-binding transcriptional LysR family regulator
VRIEDLGEWIDILRPLRRGEIDLMANRLPLAEPDIVVGPVLSREERVVAVARDHPLARRSSITLEDLANYRVARIESWTPEQAEGACPSHAPSGRRIRRTRESPTNFAALLRMVAVGEAVHPTVPSLRDFAGRPDVVFVPLAGLPPAESALISRRGPTSRRLQAFVDVARQLLPPELSRPAAATA